jgi:hypothetical protein
LRGFNSRRAFGDAETTGFSPGAIDYAHSRGIDLRAVDEITPELTRWPRLRSMKNRENRQILNSVSFLLRIRAG